MRKCDDGIDDDVCVFYTWTRLYLARKFRQVDTEVTLFTVSFASLSRTHITTGNWFHYGIEYLWRTFYSVFIYKHINQLSYATAFNGLPNIRSPHWRNRLLHTTPDSSDNRSAAISFDKWTGQRALGRLAQSSWVYRHTHGQFAP